MLPLPETCNAPTSLSGIAFYTTPNGRYTSKPPWDSRRAILPPVQPDARWAMMDATVVATFLNTIRLQPRWPVPTVTVFMQIRCREKITPWSVDQLGELNGARSLQRKTGPFSPMWRDVQSNHLPYRARLLSRKGILERNRRGCCWRREYRPRSRQLEVEDNRSSQPRY
jgi:hypothetical protein